jgi:sugar phosphate isomerase/epimerase
MNRRQFNLMVMGSMLMPAYATLGQEHKSKQALFDISISQWSFHQAMFGASRDDGAKFVRTLHKNPDAVLLGDMDPREITRMARKLGVSIVDLVNVLWFGHAQDKPWLKEFKQRADDDGVTFKLLMCDETGSIGSSDSKLRTKAVENHIPWMEAAAELGCSQLRVNAYGDGTYLAQLNQCAEGLHRLSDLGIEYGLQVLVENHGHQSNVGAWLAMLMDKTAHENCGVFLDFDNFFMGGWNIEPPRWYDRYQGIMDLAPYAKGISAKAHDFADDGNETTIDYKLCMDILFAANFQGTISAEFEGTRLSEFQGSLKTIELIRRYQYG